MSHNLQKGDKVRITNVISHPYGPDNFNEGDVSVVLSDTPLMGIVPGVMVKPTKADHDPRAANGVPFAFEDLEMLEKVE